MKKVITMLCGLFIISTLSFGGSALSDQEDFIKVADKAMPAVVNINTETQVKQRYYDPFEDFFNDPFFGDMTPRRQQPKETTRKTTALGSGFVISEDGYIITNNHVIDKADKIEVSFGDKSKYKAKVVGTDPDTDVAVLKIDVTKKLPFLEFADSDEVKIGQWAIAIGNPFGFNNTMTVGIVSAKGRAGMNIEGIENFIQTDASINPGNSGGPLVDITGKVIGINTAIYSQSGGNIGIGFAIPVNMAKKVTDSIIKKGKVERGWLGIAPQAIDADLAKRFGLDKAEGALIGEVIKDTPAEKAGLKRGDIIVAVDGKALKSEKELISIIKLSPPGTVMKFGLLRNGKNIEISVTLGKSEEVAAQTGSGQQSYLGMSLKTLDADTAKKYGYEKDLKGVAVIDVEPNSRAYDLGIRAGDIILEANNQDINTMKDFTDIYNKAKDGDSILLYIAGRNSSRYVLIEKSK